MGLALVRHFLPNNNNSNADSTVNVIMESRSEQGEKPLVSIIIPSYKSYKTLRYVLASIKKQTYKNIEVIVVDRPSEDSAKIKELVEKLNFKYVSLNAERTRAVNYGAKISKGEYIYYIGSDYVLEPNLIERVVEEVVKEKADAAIIDQVVYPKGFWPKVRWLEKECYKKDRLMEAARFFTRKAFFDVGGYDESMVAYEEHDLHNRLLEKGYKIIRVEGVKEINIGEPDSLKEYVRKFYYYGKTITKYLEKHPKIAIAQLNPVRPAYLRHWRKFVRHPILTIGFIIYQITRYVAAGIGYLVVKLSKRG